MLISEEYRGLQNQLHRDREDYGTSSPKYAPIITDIINQMGVNEVLDYGAGKGLLPKALKPDHDVRVRLYDPAIAELSKHPEPAQMVVCTDVLEHIEPESIDDVLDDIKNLAVNVCFISVSMVPARKFLADGRNAHLIQRPLSWWVPKLMERFTIKTLMNYGSEFWIVALPNGDI